MYKSCEGTSSQQRLKQLMIGKQRMVTKKFQTYECEVRRYHQTFRNDVNLPCPNLATVRLLNLDDPFWDIGGLTHPAEPWATDPDTKLGIQAFLTSRTCEEELKRIAREVRQMIRSAQDMATKIDLVETLSTVCRLLLFLSILKLPQLIHGVLLQLGILTVPRVQKRSTW